MKRNNIGAGGIPIWNLSGYCFLVYTTRKNKKEQGRNIARHSYIATNNKIGLIITVSKGMHIKSATAIQ
jgi:hypothetical protein